MAPVKLTERATRCFSRYSSEHRAYPTRKAAEMAAYAALVARVGGAS